VLSELGACTVLERVDVESLEERTAEGASESSEGVEREDDFDAVAESRCPPVPRVCTSHLQLQGQKCFHLIDNTGKIRRGSS
jgi:hypothetical protein